MGTKTNCISAYSKYFHTQQSLVNVFWACQIGGERSGEGGSCMGIGKIECKEKYSFPFLIFSCEEAALEGQMFKCVCLSDCLTPKLNITKVMLFEVYKTN